MIIHAGTIMSFTLEEIQAEAKRILKAQEENKELERQHKNHKALQEVLAKQEAIQKERIRLLAEEEQIRLTAQRLVIEAEAKTIADAKETAIQKELERLRNRSPVEVLEDKVRDLEALLKTPPVQGQPSPPQQDLILVKKLQEHISLLEKFILQVFQPNIIGDPGLLRVVREHYKQKRGFSQNKKFKFNINQKDCKDWGVNFYYTWPFHSGPFIGIGADYTTNSVRIYKQTDPWPHATIGLLPFKFLGFDNKSETCSFIVVFTPETIEIKNTNGEGESFRYDMTTHGALEDLGVWSWPHLGYHIKIEEIFE